MRATSSTFRTVLIAALVGLAASLTASVVTATGAGAATCSDVDVAFARGTGEAAGLGITGTPFVNSLKSALAGKTVSSYAVNYAAAADQSSAGPGGTDMSNHVSSVAASCPGTVFVIGGYSQGASVTDVAVGVQTGGTAIPANLSGRVAAVVVFGNPLGLRGKTIATASTVYGPKSKDYCNTGDPVCGGGNDITAHLAYASNGSTTAGAQFAAGLVKGGTTTTPPTTAPTTPPVTAPTTPPVSTPPVTTPPVTTPPVTAPTTPPVTAPTTPTTPVGTCVTASTSKQISDGRAFSMFGFAFAKGSRSFLGMASPFVKVSLTQVDAKTWKKVAHC